MLNFAMYGPPCISRALRIHGFNHLLEAFMDNFTFNLHGGGYFPVLFIKPLGNNCKFADTFHPCKGGIYGCHLFADQFV